VPEDVDCPGHAPRRFEFEVVPLAIVHRKRVKFVAIVPRDGRRGRRVKPPG
jgi:hypothetical protein